MFDLLNYKNRYRWINGYRYGCLTPLSTMAVFSWMTFLLMEDIPE